MSPWNVPDIDGSLTNVRLSPSGSVAENFLAKKKFSICFIAYRMDGSRCEIFLRKDTVVTQTRGTVAAGIVAVGIVQWGLLRGCATDCQLLTFKYHLIQGQPTLKYHQEEHTHIVP